MALGAPHRACLVALVVVRVAAHLRQRVARELLVKVMLVVGQQRLAHSVEAAAAEREPLVQMVQVLANRPLLVLVVLDSKVQSQVQRLTMLAAAAVAIIEHLLQMLVERAAGAEVVIMGITAKITQQQEPQIQEAAAVVLLRIATPQGLVAAASL